MLQAICSIQNPFGHFAIPPSCTCRVDSSMKKRIMKRWSPFLVQASTVALRSPWPRSDGNDARGIPSTSSFPFVWEPDLFHAASEYWHWLQLTVRGQGLSSRREYG